MDKRIRNRPEWQPPPFSSGWAPSTSPPSPSQIAKFVLPVFLIGTILLAIVIDSLHLHGVLTSLEPARSGTDVVAQLTPNPSAAPSATTAATAELTAASTPMQTVMRSPTSEFPSQIELLPDYRIIAFYGHPSSASMGILGEYSKEDLLAQLRLQAAEFEAVDPETPLLLAFEIIATVAQAQPYDGSYLLATDLETLNEYADFAEQNGLLLIIDLQIGRSTVSEELERMLPLLKRPNVHVALDPEFAVDEGEIPGQMIGGIDAASIAEAQATLAELAREENIPAKILIVHQFVEGMIRDANMLTPVEGVQLVIDFDGFGSPSNKFAGYAQFVDVPYVQFGGFKLFYQQDEPLMDPIDIINLSPPPSVIIYQ